MRRPLFRLFLIGIPVLLVLMVGTYFFLSKAQVITGPTQQSTSGNKVTLSPVVDQLAQQVLTNMHSHAWNPNATTRNIVTGGLYINWKMDAPTVTNAVRPGPDGNPQHNHDIQVDLLYLTALADYHAVHPQDSSYNADIAHLTSVVSADFRVYSLPKGWIYFYLLHDGLIFNNSTLINEAHTIASNYYTHWFDPTLGFVYDRAHHPGDYATNSALQCGAALIDAGQRWKQPSWVTAGKSTIDHVLSVGWNQHYQLFYESMIVNPSGADTVENYQAKPSTQGEAVDSLITAYQLTHNQHYLDIARKTLQSLFGSSNLWDRANGGFYFALELNTGNVLSAYKETRSQTLTLIALHDYNQVDGQAMASQEQELLTTIATHFYQSTYHGFFYRLTPTFRIYVSRAGTGIGVEDYFSTEAMGAALVALQQTEMAQ